MHRYCEYKSSKGLYFLIFREIRFSFSGVSAQNSTVMRSIYQISWCRWGLFAFRRRGRSTGSSKICSSILSRTTHPISTLYAWSIIQPWSDEEDNTNFLMAKPFPIVNQNLRAIYQNKIQSILREFNIHIFLWCINNTHQQINSHQFFFLEHDGHEFSWNTKKRFDNLLIQRILLSDSLIKPYLSAFNTLTALSGWRNYLSCKKAIEIQSCLSEDKPFKSKSAIWTSPCCTILGWSNILHQF